MVGFFRCILSFTALLCRTCWKNKQTNEMQREAWLRNAEMSSWLVFINFTCRKCNLEDLMPPKGLPGQIIKEIGYAFTKFSTEFPSATEMGSTEMFWAWGQALRRGRQEVTRSGFVGHLMLGSNYKPSASITRGLARPRLTFLFSYGHMVRLLLHVQWEDQCCPASQRC